jgi:hypothetical protein
MNGVLLFILTKTGIIRWVGNYIATALVGYGIVEGNEQAQVAGAVVAIITGLMTKWIEAIKDRETKKTQRMLDAITPEHIAVKADGLSGPKTRAAITAVKIASNPNRKG